MNDNNTFENNISGWTRPFENMVVRSDHSRRQENEQNSGDSAMSSLSREEIDAKIAAAEARVDTKFATLIGELSKIEASTSGIKATVVATGLTALAITISVFAFGGQMFGIGLDAQNVASSAVEQTETRFNERLRSIEEQISGISTQLNLPRSGADTSPSIAPSSPAD